MCTRERWRRGWLTAMGGILTLQGLYEKVTDGRIMVFVEGSKDLWKQLRLHHYEDLSHYQGLINYFSLLHSYIYMTAVMSCSYKACIVLDSVHHSRLVLTPKPNKTKPPLQVLAVIEGNSEKIRFEDQTCDVGIYWIEHEIIYLYIYHITFFSFPINKG